MNRVQVTLKQVEKLVSLRDPESRAQLRTNLLRRRTAETNEPGRGGRRRPALDSVPASQRPDDRVVVADAEVLVLDNSGVRARQVLAEAFGKVDDDFEVLAVCGTIERVLLPDDIKINNAVDRLNESGITASANGVAMMGGTAKGGATPKSTTDGVDAKVDAPEQQGTGPLVIVIDTGIDDDAKNRGDGWVTHVGPLDAAEDLDPKDVLDQRGRVKADNRLDLAAGHGTFVAGIVSQIEPEAEIVMIRAIATDGVCTEGQVAEALCRAAAEFEDRQLDRGVVNMSLGLQSVDDEEPPMLRAALNMLPDEVIVVAAAGNERTGVELWPAASPRVCGVASLTDQNTASEWSNRGSWVDFSARGEGIISTFVMGKETPALPHDPGSPFDRHPDRYKAPDPLAVWSGTSFSTPQVSAQLASILKDNPGITRAAAIQRLHDRGTPLSNFGTRVPVF